MYVILSMLFLWLEHPGRRWESPLFPKDPETSRFISKFILCKGKSTVCISGVNRTIWMSWSIESQVGWNKIRSC